MTLAFLLAPNTWRTIGEVALIGLGVWIVICAVIALGLFAGVLRGSGR